MDFHSKNMPIRDSEHQKNYSENLDFTVKVLANYTVQNCMMRIRSAANVCIPNFLNSEIYVVPKRGKILQKIYWSFTTTELKQDRPVLKLPIVAIQI